MRLAAIFNLGPQAAANVGRAGTGLSRALAVAFALAAAAPGGARAQEPAAPTAPVKRGPAEKSEDSAPQPPDGAAKPPPASEPEPDAEAFRALSRPGGLYARLFGTLELGDGLRFNNPYRLSTELGSTARSVSLTASYLDLGASMTFTRPEGLQHGLGLHLSTSLAGVSQQILVPSYVVALRGPRRVLAYGRLGAAIILSPDANFGNEVAVGLGYFLTAKVALAAELVGDLFYGAGTRETGYAAYPIVSAQLGLLVDHEILP